MPSAYGYLINFKINAVTHGISTCMGNIFVFYYFKILGFKFFLSREEEASMREEEAKLRALLFLLA